MANTGSPGRRAGRRLGSITRGDLLIFLLTAALCSASYCLGIWHNSRGAGDSRLLGPSAVVAGLVSCGGGARAADDEPLDFEAHHTAEGAGLSVSASAAAAGTTSARRALRGAAPASRAAARPGNSARGAEGAAAGKR